MIVPSPYPLPSHPLHSPNTNAWDPCVRSSSTSCGPATASTAVRCCRRTSESATWRRRDEQSRPSTATKTLTNPLIVGMAPESSAATPRWGQAPTPPMERQTRLAFTAPTAAPPPQFPPAPAPDHAPRPLSPTSPLMPPSSPPPPPPQGLT
jgi:hypothetical protein